MLTDGFSPRLVASGATREALELVLDHTLFRVRVLTKNAIVGQPEWLDFFNYYRSGIIVGLSIGITDGAWAKKVELFTPPPSRRLLALEKLQDGGTDHGMLCPVFPNMLQSDGIHADQSRLAGSFATTVLVHDHAAQLLRVLGNPDRVIG